MIYEFTNSLNAMIKNADKASASEIGNEIERVKAKNGGKLRPRDLWESQKSKRAKLNKHFEWDDEVCGQKYRDQQAGQLIRSVAVVYENKEGEKKKVRAFSSVRDPEAPKQSVYVTTVDAMQDDDLRDQILQQAINGLVSWRKRWNSLTDCSKVFGHIEQALEELREEFDKETANL